jgi:hypothetical protein
MNNFLKLATFTILLSSVNCFAFDIGPKISTLGVGLEASLYDFDLISIRANANFLSLKRKLKSGDLNYDAKLKLRTIGLYGDFHPWHNNVNLIVGLVHNNNKLTVTARQDNTVTISGRNYPIGDIGDVSGKIDFRKISPYLGLGYNSHTKLATIGLEVGVLFQGRPRASITATGAAANREQMLDDVKRNAEERANKGFIRYYPVVGISVRF